MVFTETRQRVAFTGLLFSAMGVGTFIAASFAVLAPVFVDELGISRSQLGLLYGVNTVGAAFLSPLLGRLTDRFGGHAALMTVAMTATVAFLILGLAGSLFFLVIGSAVGIFSQAGCNPATNKLIAEDLPAGSQGIVVGIKQSGVQGFIFVGGVVMPVMAVTWGRFSAYAVFAVFSLLMAVTAHLYLPRSSGSPHPERADRSRLPADIWWITVYGLLLGLGSATTVLFALYTTEHLGQSVVVGGLVVAAVGLTAAPARILWARYAERSGSFRTALAAIAALSALASITLLLSGSGPWWLIWVAAVLTGVSASSWNSVGMLGLIVFAGPKAAGHASGVVLTGFLLGLGVGPALFGWMVDTTGSYTPVWSVSLVAYVLGLGAMLAWKPGTKAPITRTAP